MPANDDWLSFTFTFGDGDAFNQLDAETQALIESEATELFQIGFLQGGPGSQEYRDEFWLMMQEFAIDIAYFDWDEWRDWYDS